MSEAKAVSCTMCTRSTRPDDTLGSCLCRIGSRFFLDMVLVYVNLRFASYICILSEHSDLTEPTPRPADPQHHKKEESH